METCSSGARVVVGLSLQGTEIFGESFFGDVESRAGWRCHLFDGPGSLGPLQLQYNSGLLLQLE